MPVRVFLGGALRTSVRGAEVSRPSALDGPAPKARSLPVRVFGGAVDRGRPELSGRRSPTNRYPGGYPEEIRPVRESGNFALSH